MITVVADHRLSQRDGELGLGESHLKTVLSRCANPSTDRLRVVADLDGALDPTAVVRIAEPIGSRRGAPLGQELGPATHAHRIGGRVLLDNVERVPHRHPQAAPLSDGKVLVSPVAAEDLARGIHDAARHHFRVTSDEACVVIIVYEADLLRVGFVEDRKIEPAGDPSDIRLVILADRKQHFPEPLLRCTEEHVALVLVAVDAPQKPRRAGAPVDPRIMARGDEPGAHLPGIGMQLAELQPVIASDAGVRRATRVVLSHEVIDDPAELLLEVADVQGNPQLGRYTAGVRGVVE